MSRQEWQELVGRKRSAQHRGHRVRLWFAILAPLVCAAAMAPTMYLLAQILESLPQLSLSQGRFPNRADSR